MAEKKQSLAAMNSLPIEADTPINPSIGMWGLTTNVVARLIANGVKTAGDLRKLTEQEIYHLPWLTFPQKFAVAKLRKQLPEIWPSEAEADAGKIAED